MRSVSVTGEIHCSFIVARSRVAPIKPVTILRRESVAAVVGVELRTFLKRELNLKLNDIVFWTDTLFYKIQKVALKDLKPLWLIALQPFNQTPLLRNGGT